MNLFLTIAVMYGITFGIMHSKLFSRPRQKLASRSLFFYQLLSCPYCVGFHSGWMTYLLLVPLPSSSWDLACGLVSYAFAGTTVSGALDSLLSKIEEDDEDEDSEI